MSICTYCERPVRVISLGLCGCHYMRLKRHGDPLALSTMRGDPLRRLWAKVERRTEAECWPWLGGRKRGGHGKFSLNGRDMASSRAVWTLLHGEPEGWVLHRCGNAWCCNPAHLYDGTPGENTRDRTIDQRHRLQGNAALTAEDVEAIKRRYANGGVSQQALADEYDLSQSLVSRIIRGKDTRWKTEQET